jgi:hypothetical protein
MIKKSGREQLLNIANRHAASCGTPPKLNLKDEYLSYFENHQGEQWIFVGDRETGSASLYGGDVEWKVAHPVSKENPFPGIALQEAEKLWLITCLMALSNSSLDDIVTRYNTAIQERMDSTSEET